MTRETCKGGVLHDLWSKRPGGCPYCKEVDFLKDPPPEKVPLAAAVHDTKKIMLIEEAAWIKGASFEVLGIENPEAWLPIETPKTKERIKELVTDKTINKIRITI